MPEENTQSNTNAYTALTQKQYSPLVIRKTTKFGFPIYVAIITDDNLNMLDKVVWEFINNHMAYWTSNRIEDKRWLAGALNEHLATTFPSTEGVAVLLSVDKTFISSLHGDFMTHTPCRLELYTLLNMGTNV